MSELVQTLWLTPKRLGEHALFKGWSRVNLNELFNTAEILCLTAGELVFQRGQHSTGFYMIDAGQVQLQIRAPGGTVKKLDLLKEGNSLGDAYMLMDKPYHMEALALSNVRLLRVTKQIFFNQLLQQPALMKALIATLSERLHHLVGDVLTVSLHSGTQRVICYLLADAPLKNGEFIMLNLPKAQIAAALNLTPEHFSRILHDLSTRRYIAVDGRHIELLDIDGLCAYER